MKRLVFLSAFAMAAVLLAIMITQPRSAAKNASATFLGYTNFALSRGNTQRVAAFVISNGTPERIACGARFIDVRRNGDWARHPGTTNITGGGALNPRESRIIHIRPPGSNDVWRAHFFCSEKASFFRQRLGDLWRDFRQSRASITKVETFSGRTYHVISEEIPPEHAIAPTAR